ncbi:PREDICTED: fatty acid synthase-like, partial [Priapulus caudatus]|uniref:Fatty acid synthase-like n=1 Tax=Priapulus caudatus TaxID=37621 RepID=A0ABM1FBP9_PRICU
MMLSGVLRHLTCGPCAGQRRFLVGLAQTGPARWTGVICSQQAKFCSSSADGHKNKNVTGRREVWFWFWGINSHWPGMARDMLKFPAFCNSIAKSSEIVSDLAGINLLRLVTSMEKKKVDPAMDCVYTNVSIVGMQIGLVDLLRSLDIVPDRICGISL